MIPESSVFIGTFLLNAIQYLNFSIFSEYSKGQPEVPLVTPRLCIFNLIQYVFSTK